MTDPIPGGDGWAQAVVEGVAEGEQVRPASSPPNASGAKESSVSPPKSDEPTNEMEADPEAEIAEPDLLDPEDETGEIRDPSDDRHTDADSGGPEVTAEEAEPMDDELNEVEEVVEDRVDGDESADTDEVHVTVEDLVTDLERVSIERDQYLEASRRLQAEFENYKKQVAKREATARDRANDSLIGELLPVLDAFDGAISNGAQDVAPMRSAMLDALSKQGLERIDPPDAAFDPSFHEAVMHEADSDVEDGPVVSEVLRAGYSWKGRVLRPAMVKTRG